MSFTIQPQITYLIGAGASANCIPVVGEMVASLQNFHKGVNALRVSGSRPFPGTTNIYPSTVLQKFKQISETVLNAAEVHWSIDTYAKKLFLTGDLEMYQYLKAYLSCYFGYIQTINFLDKRYDVLYASLLQKTSSSVKMPNNVKVLSWNYDTQFERAFNFYYPNLKLSEVGDVLNVCTDPKDHFNHNEFGIIKLNGTIGYRNKEEKNLADDIHLNRNRSKVVESLLPFFYEASPMSGNSTNLDFSFAWEDGENQYAQKVLENTDILIVIGYSFPYYNRYVDSKILENNSIEKVYFQDPYADSIQEKFIQSFNCSSIKEFVKISGVENFHIPIEL